MIYDKSRRKEEEATEKIMNITLEAVYKFKCNNIIGLITVGLIIVLNIAEEIR